MSDQAWYDKLLETQQPLEPEFQQILDNNFWELCEDDS